MATKLDYYDLLGVPRNASPEEIKKAFRRLAMKHHPDRNREPGAEERFKEINEAYEVLADPQKRSVYDRFGHAGMESPFARGFDGFDLGGFGDIFDAFFGGTASRRRRQPQRGPDLRLELTLTFEEAVFGCEKEFEVPRHEPCSVCKGLGAAPGSEPEKCSACGGSGEVRRVQRSIFGQFINVATCDRCGGEGRVITHPCRHCRGSGREKKPRKLQIRVPAGVDSGSQMRLTGEGEMGSYGGARGNLYVAFSVLDHPLFERDGDSVIYSLNINVAQAALGDEVQIPTLNGERPLKIPAGTQSDHLFVLRKQGVPHVRGDGRGDMIVRVRVVTPTHLNEEQKRLLTQLKESLGEDGSAKDGKGIIDKIKNGLG